MTRNEVLDKLLSKYGKYGYTRLKISGLIKDGEKHGFSYTMIYNGLRMAFSNVTGIFQPAGHDGNHRGNTG